MRRTGVLIFFLVLLPTAKGLEVEAAKRQFSLPRYELMPGFKAFSDVNFRCAYRELSEHK